MHYYVAFDIGGTNIRAALLSKNFKILSVNEERTATNHSAILRQTKGVFDELIDMNGIRKSQIRAVGISVAAEITRGKVNSHNLKLRRGTKIEPVFSQLLGLPVRALNDMKSAAFGELNFGEGKGYKNFFAITFSTGVGSGWIANGDLIFGANGLTGEVSQSIIDISSADSKESKKFGNFEALASGSGLELIYKKLTGKNISAYEIQKRAEGGEAKALLAFDKSAKAIGYGLASLINSFDPELVILSGTHIVKGKKLLFPTIKKVLKKQARTNPKIVFSAGDKMTLLGAAKWAEDHR